MAFLADIKDKLYRRRLLADAKSPEPATDGRPPRPDTAADVTIVFLADAAEDRRAVDRWRDKEQRPGRKIRVLGYFEQEVGAASFDFEVITPKDLNWYGIPESDAVTKYRGAATDLLMRFGPADHKVLDYLAAIKPARFRIGPYSTDTANPYHLQFDAGHAPKTAEQQAVLKHIFSFTNATKSTKV